MSVRGSLPAFTALAIVAILVSLLEAAPGQFVQAPGVSRNEILPPQRPQQQPLFPVPPLEVPKPAPPRSQAEPVVPIPPTTPSALPTLKPRVVCGMTLIPAMPAIDPKIGTDQKVEKPKNPTTYTIRPVQPSICWE